MVTESEISCCCKALLAAAAISPEAPATSRNDSSVRPVRAATLWINWVMARILPNQRLMRRRSASEPAISSSVPASLSSSSGMGMRFIASSGALAEGESAKGKSAEEIALKGHGFRGCGKSLFGREDVSGHGFIRAAKLLKTNNTDLPKACA